MSELNGHGRSGNSRQEQLNVRDLFNASSGHGHNSNSRRKQLNVRGLCNASRGHGRNDNSLYSERSSDLGRFSSNGWSDPCSGRRS